MRERLSWPTREASQGLGSRWSGQVEGLFWPGYVVSASCLPLLMPLEQVLPGPLGRMLDEKVTVDLSIVGRVNATERQARKAEREAERILSDVPV